MKIVKITRKFKQYNSGHTVALRFDNYDESRAYEVAAAKIFPESIGGWRQHGSYYSWFGARSGRSNSRPYFISFRDESAVTMVLLAIDK
jgi:hypothetical protein